MKRIKSHRSMTERVVNFILSIHASDRALYNAGLQWYAIAADVCRSMAKRHGLDPELVVQIMALLSPQMSWPKNIELANKVCAAVALGKRPSSVGGQTTKNLAKVDRVVRDRPLGEAETLPYMGESAPKVKAFYVGIKRSLYGQGLVPGEEVRDVVCLDRHAIRVCDEHNAEGKVGVVEHRCMREAYAEATQILNDMGHNLLPWQTQAIAWCAIRGSAE
jgi:hypothetical protein